MTDKNDKPENPAADDAAAPEAAAAADDATAAAAPGSADSPAPESPAAPDSPLSSLEEQLAKYKDMHLRAIAEMENMRRRAEKQIADAHKFALANFARSIGDVRDCLETAVTVVDNGEKMREGVALTLRKLTTAMDAHHISPISPDIGVSFDSSLHEAIGMAPPTENAPAGAVAAVVQVGYMLSGRIVRPAKVMVSGESPAAAGAADNAAQSAKSAN